MIRHKFYLRTPRLNGAGESALYFIFNTRPQAWVATGVFIQQDFWNQKKQLLLPCSKYRSLQSELTNLKAKADMYLLKLQVDQKNFSAADFTRVLATGGTEEAFNPLFITMVQEYADHTRLSIGRYKHYLVCIGELKQLAPSLRLNQVDYSFAKQYEKWLRSKGNQINTIGGKIKKIKAVVHYAMNKGLLQQDPLAMVKVSTKRSNRTALTSGELLDLQGVLDLGRGLSGGHLQTLRNFLFSCYTGLRYSDIKTLKHSDIKNDCIKIDMHKTGTPVSVPVITRARALLQYMPGGNCFHVFTNEASNRHLKEIARYAGIGKVLTFHVSRHTFATISLQLGIGIKTVSEILGHSSVKQTENYLHLLDEMKAAEMQKWEQLSA